jgi:nitrate reductase (cytochrome), electron transfer subunit
MRTTLLPILAAASILAACATTKPVGVPAADMGLQRGPVLETAVPPKLAVNNTAPGDAPLPARSWAGVAPVVPHAIADFVPITVKENACMACHAVAAKEKGGPTPIPRSHDADDRNEPGKAASKLTGARYVCVSCHVESTAAKPLVRSDFKP